ncbi:uncharacterized protein LOC129315694 [Prosopis cineraria]|uniref:uncharacterized protein LOC129315694 n=1 Tax=Prosopis cineraria TaxID=364024 RepID=UPI00240EAF98|nr:uncharacterized protein LOC129315694 [Prosopis cineraria]
MRLFTCLPNPSVHHLTFCSAYFLLDLCISSSSHSAWHFSSIIICDLRSVHRIAIDLHSVHRIAIGVRSFRITIVREHHCSATIGAVASKDVYPLGWVSEPTLPLSTILTSDAIGVCYSARASSFANCADYY